MPVRSGRAALELAAVPASAADARTFVRSKLDELGVPEPPLEDAVLLASELVTNGIRHARTDLEVRLRTDPGRVRIEVHDGSDRYPRPRPAAPDATGGRGLLLVERLANGWGVDQAGPGKTVWFELVVGRT